MANTDKAPTGAAGATDKAPDKAPAQTAPDKAPDAPDTDTAPVAPVVGADALDALDAPQTQTGHATDERFPVVEILDGDGNVIGDMRAIHYKDRGGRVSSRIEFALRGGGRQMLDGYAFSQYARAVIGNK